MIYADGIDLCFSRVIIKASNSSGMLVYMLFKSMEKNIFKFMKNTGFRFLERAWVQE